VTSAPDDATAERDRDFSEEAIGFGVDPCREEQGGGIEARGGIPELQ